MQPPIEDIDSYFRPGEQTSVGRMLACSVVGDPEEVRAGLQDLQARTGADEFILMCDLYDPAARARSLELTAQAWGLSPRA